MRRQPTQLLVVLLALSAAGGCHSVGANVAGVSNFARVSSGLYRGAQPSEQGIATLEKQGIRTVVDLRDDANPNERAWVASRGMKYVRIPQNATLVESEKVRAFLAQMETAQKPVFVHCRQGRDRTGLSVAVYRIVSEGWDRDAALRELYAHGYNWPLFPGIARYLRTFEPSAYRSDDAMAGGG